MHYVSRINNSIKFKENLQLINFLKNLGHEVILVGDMQRYDLDPEECKYESIQKATKNCSISFFNFKKQRDLYEPTLTELSSQFEIPFLRFMNRCVMKLVVV